MIAYRQKPAQLRLGLPTLALRDIRFLPIAMLITLGTFLGATDLDLWWHLRTGQLIISGYPMMSSDPFSWTTSGRTWFLHEWLSEAIIYWVQSNLGFGVAVAISAISIVTTLAIAYRLALRVCSRELIVAGVLLLSATMLLQFATVRPQVFTWLFFAIFVRQLYLNYQGERVSLWPLPLLMVVWSNMHLGYLFGLMTVWIWVVSIFLRDPRAGFGPVREPLILAVLCSLAPAISPIGPRALLVPVDYLGNHSVAFSSIVEWRSPDFHSIRFVPLLASLATLLATGLPTGRRHLFGLLLSLVVLVLTLMSLRNIPLFAVVFLPIASQAIAQRWPGQRGRLQIGIPAMNWALVTITTALLIAMLSLLKDSQVHSEPNVSEDLPSAGVAYIREHELGSRMLNSYEWGGYLIAELYPQVKVSIDGRSELYGNELLSQYLTLVNLEPGWRTQLARMGPDFILLPKKAALAEELRYEPGWKLAFEGPVEVIFIPKESSDGTRSPRNPS